MNNGLISNENWMLHIFFGVIVLILGIWLEKRRDKTERKWYHGGYIDFRYKAFFWVFILGGQILIWQGIMILLNTNWLPVIGLYTLSTGAFYLYQSFTSAEEASWYNRVIRNKGFALGLVLAGAGLIVLGW